MQGTNKFKDLNICERIYLNNKKKGIGITGLGLGRQHLRTNVLHIKCNNFTCGLRDINIISIRICPT